MRELSLRILRLCPSPFIWFFVASWLASASAAAAVEAPEEVVRYKNFRSSLDASPRRQTAIYRFGSSALMPKDLPTLDIARVDLPQEEVKAVANDAEAEKNWPVGAMVLLGLASLIFPIIAYLFPKFRKSETIPLHQGYATVPRSEVIGHSPAFTPGAVLTQSTTHQPEETAQPTQFFYIGEENVYAESQPDSPEPPEAPTESEPEAELCPESTVTSPSHQTPHITQTERVPAPVMLPRLPQPVSFPQTPPVLPAAFDQHEDPSTKENSHCRMLMLYASPLCRLDARGPVPLPALCIEKGWKNVLNASAEAHCGPSTFAARALTSGSLQRALSPGASLGSTILDLSAHGTPQGLVLEDGKGSAHLLSLELLQEMLALRNNSQSPCKLVVVNACHSRAVGQLLADSGMPHIVCCNDRVLDMWVELFMRTFYTTLFGGCTVASAFSTAALQLQCQPGIPREAAQCFCLLPEGAAHDEVIFPRKQVGVRKPLRISSLPFEQMLPELPEDFMGRTLDVWSILQHLSTRRLVAVCNQSPVAGIGKSALLDAVHRAAALHMQMRCVGVRVGTDVEDCMSWLLAIRSAVQLALAEEEWLGSARKGCFQPRPGGPARRKCLPRRQRKASQELPSVEELLDCLCHDIGLLALQWHRRTTAAALAPSTSRGEAMMPAVSARNSGCDVLLVIHGCDQLLERQPFEMQHAISTLLRHCPTRLVLSSRSRMPGPGCGQFKVIQYELGGLQSPDAARLFLRRAQRPIQWKEVLSCGNHSSVMEVRDENAPVVLQKENEREVLQMIASHPALARLKGIPLALIELASEMGHLTLTDLACRSRHQPTLQLPPAG